MPHNWASAELVRLVRHLLVFERGDVLDLLPGVPPQWLAPGAHIRVERTPTRFGRVSLGLKMLARCMAAELAPYRILVNCLAPGIVLAGMARHQLETEPQYAARVAKAVPLGQLQTAEQVARAAAFLCSDAAD